MIRKSTILLLLFYFATPLYLVQAQDTTGFSYDPALFLNELEAVFSKAPEKNKKEAAELITSLRNAFNSEKLTHKLSILLLKLPIFLFLINLIHFQDFTITFLP